MLQDYADVIERNEVHVALHGDEVVGVVVLARTAEGSASTTSLCASAIKARGSVVCSFSWPSRRQLAKLWLNLSLHQRTDDGEHTLYGSIVVEYDHRIVDGYPRVFLRKSLT